MNFVSYFKSTVAELKQVKWPTMTQTVNLTLLVIAISFAVGAYVGGLDFLFTNILTLVLK